MIARELEHLVRSVGSHQVCARANVRRVRTLGDELEGERVPAGCDTIGALVVCTINSAVSGTRLVVGTGGRVPLVASVAVGVSETMSVAFQQTLPS
jgi:hypothetical protein